MCRRCDPGSIVSFFYFHLFISSPCWSRVILQTKWRGLQMEMKMEARRSRKNKRLTKWRKDKVGFLTDTSVLLYRGFYSTHW